MSLRESFEQSVKKLESFDERPGNEDLLKLYALYKQATIGNVADERPVGFDFKAIAKYNAWNALKDMTQDDAMKEYIQLVDSLSAN